MTPSASSTISRALDLKFSRIQFTPDLMPSDITGTEVIEEDKASGTRVLRFVKGPIFANIILADEINRTPPKTQAALLEAMRSGEPAAGVHLASCSFYHFDNDSTVGRQATYLVEGFRAMRYPASVCSYGPGGYSVDEYDRWWKERSEQTPAGR